MAFALNLTAQNGHPRLAENVMAFALNFDRANGRRRFGGLRAPD